MANSFDLNVNPLSGSQLEVKSDDATTPLSGTEKVLLTQNGATVESTTQAIADLGGGSSYLVYTVLLDQSGTNAPTPIVLQNTLGTTVTWTYVDVGNYVGTFGTPLGAGAYSTAWLVIANNFGAAYNYSIYFNGADANSVSIEVVQISTGNPVNGKLSSNAIEIRNYV